MKRYLLLLPFLFLLTAAKAGDNDRSIEKRKKFILSASTGTNITLRDFSSKAPVQTNDTTHVHGYTVLGYYFDLSAGYQITDVVGVMVMLNGNFDSFNTVAYQNAYAYTVPNALAEGEVTASKDFFLVQYLAGLNFEIPSSKNKLSKVSVKLLAGSMKCNYPSLYSDEGNIYTQTIPGGSGFSYRLGIGYESYASESIRVSFNIAYSGGNITYPSVTTTETGQGGNYSYTSTSPRTMSVGLVQLSTGVAFLF